MSDICSVGIAGARQYCWCQTAFRRSRLRCANHWTNVELPKFSARGNTCTEVTCYRTMLGSEAQGKEAGLFCRAVVALSVCACSCAGALFKGALFRAAWTAPQVPSFRKKITSWRLLVAPLPNVWRLVFLLQSQTHFLTAWRAAVLADPSLRISTLVVAQSVWESHRCAPTKQNWVGSMGLWQGSSAPVVARRGGSGDSLPIYNVLFNSRHD